MSGTLWTRWRERISPPAGLRMAVTTFTAIPIEPGRIDHAVAGRALLWCPLLGAGLGAVAGVPLLVRPLLPGTTGSLLLAVVAVAILAALTRGLHLDGLADSADGLGSGRRGDGAAEVMKRSDVGPFGVVTLVFTILAQVTAIAAGISTGRAWQALILAGLVSRLAVVHAATPATPPAPASTLGAMVAGTVTTRSAAIWTAGAVVLCLVPLLAGQLARTGQLLAALAAGLGAAELLRRHAIRRFGGISGDVFGALIETATVAVLVVMVLG